MIIKLKDGTMMDFDYVDHKMIEKDIYVFTKTDGTKVVLTNVKEVEI